MKASPYLIPNFESSRHRRCPMFSAIRSSVIPWWTPINESSPAECRRLAKETTMLTTPIETSTNAQVLNFQLHHEPMRLADAEATKSASTQDRRPPPNRKCRKVRHGSSSNVAQQAANYCQASGNVGGNVGDNGVAAKHRERRNQLRRNSRSSHGSSIYGCRQHEVGRT